MKINEAAVFKWVVIVGVAAATVIALALLVSQLIGAIWFFVLVIAGSVYGCRWLRRKWPELRR